MESNGKERDGMGWNGRQTDANCVGTGPPLCFIRPRDDGPEAVERGTAADLDLDRVLIVNGRLDARRPRQVDNKWVSLVTHPPTRHTPRLTFHFASLLLGPNRRSDLPRQAAYSRRTTPHHHRNTHIQIRRNKFAYIVVGGSRGGGAGKHTHSLSVSSLRAC